MDPASVVLGVISGAATLTAMSVKTTTYLVCIPHILKQTDMLFPDFIAAIKAFSIAWDRIHEWAEGQKTTPTNDGSAKIFEQLLSYL